MKVRDLKTLPNYDPTILIYGGLGTGKTAFLSQAGPHGLLFDFDRGLKTALTMPDRYKEQRLDLEFEDFFEDKPQTAEVWPKAISHIFALEKKWKASPSLRRRIVIIDSFTGLVKCVKYNLLKKKGHQQRTLTQPEWGILFMEIENFLDAFRGLPAIKIIAGHDMLVDDPVGMTIRRLCCPGQKSFPREVAGFFDDVFFTKITQVSGKRNFMLSSKGTPTLEARTRTNFRDDFNMNDGLFKLLENLGYPIDGVTKA